MSVPRPAGAALALLSMAVLATGCRDARAGGSQERAALTAPPAVPPPITRRSPAAVVVELEAREQTSELLAGVQYTFWTFGGTVPGRSSASAKAITWSST